MKTLLLFVLVFLGYPCLYATDCDTIASNNSLIEYTGRIDFTNPLKPEFSYSGVSIRASFRGTRISVILNDASNQNNYNILIDGKVIRRLKTIKGLITYTISTSLNDTIHDIELIKLTEEMFGKTQFCGFILDKGKKLEKIRNVREHLLEFIGNSITCGYGNEGVMGEKFGPDTENHFLTYASITSRLFNARHLAVCKSGIGIYRNYDGPVEGNEDCMPNCYQRIFIHDSIPSYNFLQRPDLICIDLGTNDFSTTGCDSAIFIRRYIQFIQTIQLKNNGTDILCLLGPMITGNDLIHIRHYLHIIVEAANQKQSGHVYFFEMSSQTGTVGIDYHPTVEQHYKNARELVQYIKVLKGWTVWD